MAVFFKRPLAAGCFTLILSVLAAYFLPISVGMVFMGLSLAFMLFLLLFTCIKRPTYGKLYLFLICLGLLCGMGRTVYIRVQRDSALETYIGKEVIAEFQVTEVKSTTSYGSRANVKIRSVNGEEKSGAAVFVASYPSPFLPGDIFEGRVTVSDLSFDTYYQGQAFSYRAEGCSVTLCSSSAESLRLKGREISAFAEKLNMIRDRSSHILTEYIDGEEGKLVSALLLGTREDLSDRTIRDFRRVGISHLLALSGLHVGILAAILDRFLRGIHVGKRLRICLILGFMLCYLIMTGCSYSIIRSVFMLSMLYMAFFFRQDADPLTSLSAAGAFILLVTPYAIFSLSYQMTMLATFGILAFAPARDAICRSIPMKKGFFYPFLRLARALVSSLLLTISATVTVLPIQWLVFGEFSLVTPLANLIFVPLSAPLLILGLLVLFAFPPKLFAFAGKNLAGLLLYGVSELSGMRTMLSLDMEFVAYIFIPLFLSLAVLLLVHLRKYKPVTFVPIVLSIIAFGICLVTYNASQADLVDAQYRVSGQNEGIVLYNVEGSVAIDLSGGSTTQMRSNWALLQESGATELDVLILTHYHNEHAISLSKFGKSVMIRALWLPAPTTNADLAVLQKLQRVAEALEIAVFVYQREQPLQLPGNLSLTVSEPLYEPRSTQPAFSIILENRKTAHVMQYDSAALSEYRRNASIIAEPIACDTYIIGTHGPIPHDTVCIDTVAGKCRTVIFSGINTLRHIKISDHVGYYYLPKESAFCFQISN